MLWHLHLYPSKIKMKKLCNANVRLHNTLNFEEPNPMMFLIPNQFLSLSLFSPVCSEINEADLTYDPLLKKKYYYQY